VTESHIRNNGDKMIVDREPLHDKAQTAAKIKQIVNKFYLDLDSLFIERKNGTMKLPDLSLAEFFDLVKNIPYRRDPRPVEVVARPYYIFKYRGLGMDCKKKAIICAAYLKARGLPFRFIGSSNRDDKKIHHIFPQVKLDNEYVNFDATYSNYQLFGPKNVTAWEVL
jgi:hypothetical protein